MARQMKDSGIEWIGEIQETWTIDRLQWHLEEVNVSNSPVQSENVLSLTIEAGVIPYEEKGNQGNKSKDNYEEYKLAYPDTLVVNSMNVIIGAVGISKYFGCVSPVYYVFKAAEGVDLRYIYYLFTNVGFQKEMRKHAKGILEIRLRISSGDMLKLSIPNPAYEEQQRIASFLDRKCAEIDAVIERTKATIEEYKKLKQAVITEAVTKGVRGARKMKDSGIEWIGEIPEDWSKDKVIRVFAVIGSGTTPKSTDESQYGGNINWIQSGDINGGLLSVCKNTISEQTLAEYSALKVYYAPFIIIAMYGASVGNSSISDIDGCVNQACCVLSMSKCNLQYAFYTFKAAKEYLIRKAVGGGQPNISQDTLRSLWLPMPSNVEQAEIVAYLDEKCAALDTLIAKKTALLTELETYKKSLIYEYVTGKKEVL